MIYSNFISFLFFVRLYPLFLIKVNNFDICFYNFDHFKNIYFELV